MAAPVTFNLPTFGAAPNQYSTETALENAVQAVLDAIFDALAGEMRSRRVATSWTERFADVSFPAETAAVVQASGTKVSVWVKMVPAPSPTTARDQQDRDGIWWREVWDSADNVLALRNAGVFSVVDVAGTADAITANLHASTVAMGITVSADMLVELRPTVENTGAVTLQVGTDIARALQTENGTALPAGYLQPGRSYLVRRVSTFWRIVTGSVSLADLIDRRLASVSGENFTATRFPLGTAGIVQTSAGKGALWAKLGTAPTTPLTGDQADADGIWWRKVWDSAAMEGQVAAERAARLSGDADLSARMDAPFAVVSGTSGIATRVDANSNAIEVMRADGLDAHMSAQFWERGRDGVGVTALQSQLDAPFQVAPTVEGVPLRYDAAGNILEMMRSDGLDMHMSAQFWARGAEILGLDGGSGQPSASRLSTTDLHAISINGQSLTVSGDYTATVTPAYLRSFKSDAALQLAGMQRGDNVPITDTLGPRSQGYNTSVPATGLALAELNTSTSSMPLPVAVAVNLHRADLGLPLVPVVTTAHGISGIPIEQMDKNPATGANTDTIVWNNFAYWFAQAKAVAAAAGKTLTVPWHVITHGTSAKASPRGDYAVKWWALQRDSMDYLLSIGLQPPRYIITQSGGDADTVGDVWAVVEDQLDICEAGGAVLATPLYWYEIADNNVHPDSEGQALYCDTMAWAMSEVDAGRRWTIGRPRATWDAATSSLSLHFDSLREDEWLEAEAATKYATSGGIGLGANALGFEAVGATITALSLRGHTVVLTCSAKPVSVKYARQVQSMTVAAGNRYTAHRGLLRTSKRKPSKLLPGKMLVRAIPSFTLPLA